MPLYDYDCAACGTRFEVVHGVHADPPTTCPVCGKGPVKKAFTPPTIHFKGSGWAKKERRATAAPGSAKSRGEGSSTSGPDGGSGGGAADGGSGSTETGTSTSDGSSSTATSTAASGPAAD